jgi:hypothetical protein
MGVRFAVQFVEEASRGSLASLRWRGVFDFIFLLEEYHSAPLHTQLSSFNDVTEAVLSKVTRGESCGGLGLVRRNLCKKQPKPSNARWAPDW